MTHPDCRDEGATAGVLVMSKHNLFIFASLLVAALAAARCGGGTEAVSPSQDAQEAAEQEAIAPADALAEARGPDGAEAVATADLRAADFAAELRFDAAADGLGPQCQPGEGCFLDKCSENSDCQSGWCVEHMGEGVCSLICQDECPAGWSCKQVGSSDPDIVYACVSNHANLCKPCATTEGCKTVGGAEDVCLSYGQEGSFCGGTCAGAEDCPWGFECQEAQTVEGVVLKQCVAAAGICPCTGKSVAMGLTTPCANANELGSCEGKRTCSPEGLSPCDAPWAQAEVCNGQDDDCDGAVDEPLEVGGDYVNLCDDGNGCTKDTCGGAAGCSHAPLDGMECKDGDPCTAADHCVAGSCVGDPVVCEDGNVCTDDFCQENGGCQHEPNLDPCDDDDPCTLGDGCKQGVCAGVKVPCDCTQDKDCAALEDGDVCNGTLACDLGEVPYECKLDPATVVACPEPIGPNAPCLKAACDPAAGTCSFLSYHDGSPCNDDDPCTQNDSCAGGVCAGEPGVNCNDGNPCTDDECVAASGCANVPNNIPCQDGSVCTVGDQCGWGKCIGGKPLPCDDGNDCTDDSCDAALGCVAAFNQAMCDDQNPCTTGDHCEQGSCVSAGIDGCNDGNGCTTDWCDAGKGCQHQPNKLLCDDGNACTNGDVCEAGKCKPGDVVVCDDGNVCTDDWCDPQSSCQHKSNAASCDDKNTCTTKDACAGGACVGTGSKDCDDQNPCTKDICLPDGGCQHENLLGPCTDDDACTTGDACKAGKCTGGPAPDCEDGNVCTDDSCHVQFGCIHANNTAACDDSNACTEADKCANGLCLPGAPKKCADDNVCTTDTCDPAKGCLTTLNQVACDDSNLCTTGDHCHLGQCIHSGDLACNDGNLCTDDSCVAETGCKFSPNVLPCDDGNACTTKDACAGGACKAGPPVVCPGGWTCSEGKCVLTCPAGLEKCDDICTNLAWDPLNCGECGEKCQVLPNASQAFCANGGCGYVCNEGFLDCNFQEGDGCEANTKTDKLNCGGCGNACPAKPNAANAYCKDSSCTFDCDGNYGNCNNQPGDGCEINLLTNDSHCGFCSNGCGPGKKCVNGKCENAVVAATCDDLVTTMSVWGKPCKGFDLRKWTNSTLHYLGCPSDGCQPGNFYCNYNAAAQTLEFGSTSGEIRAATDPGNALGDTMPNSYGGCCTGPLGLCNGPDANNNGIPVDNGKALCAALGYANGQLVEWHTGNVCPEVHAITPDGLQWGSDWVGSDGYGQRWKCTGFK
jgi:hypothetical protein